VRWAHGDGARRSERSRSAALEAHCAELEAQLHEVVKLNELMAADLERYKKVVESSRPNHPERVPEDQLQLAFERVLEAVGPVQPANDGGEACQGPP
jgi:hypothetical protein